MPRRKLQREPCDCLDCRDGGALLPPSGAAAAMARQDPPPKGLVLCITGAMHFAGGVQEVELPHLDALVRAGWAGLLACRSGGPALPLQLLGLPAPGEASPHGTLGDRFKQLRAVLLTDSAEVAQAGKLAGCYSVHQLPPLGCSNAAGWQAPVQLAARICKLLQVQPWSPADAGQPAASALPALAAVLAAAGQGAEGHGGAEDEEGDDVIDLLLVVLDAANAPGGSNASNGSSAAPTAAEQAGDDSTSSSSVISSGGLALEWADRLVSHLNQAPGFRDTVLLSLVVGPGQQPLSQEPLLQQGQPVLELERHSTDAGAAAAAAAAAAGPGAAGRAAAAAAAAGPGAADRAAAAAALEPGLRVRRPLQSYQFAGLDRVEVDALRPAVVVHRLAGVIRVDTASALDLAEIRERGAAGCILAERLLPEVAYKIGRAPKYGA